MTEDLKNKKIDSNFWCDWYRCEAIEIFIYYSWESKMEK